jgi:Hemerythrin HHE cation binding domain
MTQPGTTHRSRNTYWTLMHAQHDAFRRDLDDLLATSAGRTAVRARWAVFRDQLHFHHTAEDTAMWPPVRAKLTGDPAGLALMDAMEEEHKLIDPLLAATDDALATSAGDTRLRSLMSQLRTTLASHLAHEEADALPLISQIMSPAELTAIRKTIAKMGGLRQAAVMFPWALSTATPDVRALVIGQLPAPARLLYRAKWLPRYTRTTPRL